MLPEMARWVQPWSIISLTLRRKRSNVVVRRVGDQVSAEIVKQHIRYQNDDDKPKQRGLRE
jgi:hypothetical protein